MSYRILLVSVDFHGIGRSFDSVLKQLGHDVTNVEFTPLKYHQDIKIRLIMGRLLSERIKNKLYDWDNQRITRAVLKKAQESNPDLVIIYKGRFLSGAVLSEGKRRLPSTRWACWAMDPIEHYTLAEQEQLKVMDAVFIYDAADLDLARQINRNSYYLPAGYDAEKYYPDNSAKSHYNLCFVGSLQSYRQHYLEKIIRANGLTNRQVKIIAGNWPGLALSKKLNPAQYQSFLWQKDYISAIELDPSAVNVLYNQTEICLNLHRDELSHYGLNPRTFEIAGSGGCQLVDHHPGLESMFIPGQEIVIFQTPEEAADLFKYYAKNAKDRKAIATAGWRRASQEHRYVDRFRRMLQIMGTRS